MGVLVFLKSVLNGNPDRTRPTQYEKAEQAQKAAPKIKQVKVKKDSSS